MIKIISYFFKVQAYFILACFFSYGNFAYSETLNLITVEVAPWAYHDKVENKFLGIFPDLIREIEARTGHSINITLVPFGFSRINRELKIGRQDCTILITQPERSQFTVLGELVFNHEMGVVAHKSISLKDRDDLYGLTISVHKMLAEEGQVMDNEKLNKEFDASYEIGLRKIKHGRLNAIAGAIPTIKFLAKNLGVEDLLGAPLILKHEPIYLQCSKFSKKLKYFDDINQAIKSIKKDLSLKYIINANV